MKILGIIAEYNPFHNGHAYHIRQARELSGADYVIVVMSGDFVQRGTPAIIDKYTRTSMALSCGADLVFELPVCYATASAEYFARGAVGLLENLGVTDSLCFGSEEGELSLFRETAQILLDEPEEYSSRLKTMLAQGLSYPAARQEALFSYTGNSRLRDFLNEPNNILGIEYCKALLSLNSSMEPLTILRKGSGYHHLDLTDTYSSATAIRKAVEQGNSSDLKERIPSAAYDLLLRDITQGAYVVPDDFSMILKYKLMLEKTETLRDYLDVGEELANRIMANLNQFAGFTQFVTLLKTKELTYTRISRALLHIMLNIKSQPLEAALSQPAPYGRILGFRRGSTALFKKIKARTNLTLISKGADYPQLLKGNALSMMEQDLWCANIYESTLSNKSGIPFRNELTRQIIMLP